MSAKKDSSNNYTIITKSNIFRFDLIQGFLENTHLKIRLLVDNHEKTRNSYFSIIEKFESVKVFNFEKTSSDPEYLKFKESNLYQQDQYQKYFEKKRDFSVDKVIIFLDDFVKRKEKSDYRSLKNARSLPPLKHIGPGTSILEKINKMNCILYSDYLHTKSYIYNLKFVDLEKDIMFYSQLFYLLKMLKFVDAKTVLFADSEKYKNTFEGLLIRSILSAYGIKYNFVDFKYFANEKNVGFVFPLKFLVFKNKKYIYTKFALKQIYEQIINDNAINYEILQDAYRKAGIEKDISLDKIKKAQEVEEEIDLDEVKDKDESGIYLKNISLLIKKIKSDKKDYGQENDYEKKDLITRIFLKYINEKINDDQNVLTDNEDQLFKFYSSLIKNLSPELEDSKNESNLTNKEINKERHFSSILDLLERNASNLKQEKIEKKQNKTFSQYLRFKYTKFVSNIKYLSNAFDSYFPLVNPFSTQENNADYPFEAYKLTIGETVYRDRLAKFALGSGIAIKIASRFRK